MALGFQRRHPLIDAYLSRENQQAVRIQNDPRTDWKDYDSPQAIMARICEETCELNQAVEECMLGADPFAVASEVGDIFYLAVKLQKTYKGKFPPEVSRCISRAIEVCELTGLNIDECVTYKIWRNDYKYPLIPASTGWELNSSVNISKRMYKQLGGDDNFNQAYMQLGDEIFAATVAESSFWASAFTWLMSLPGKRKNSTVR